MPDHRMIAGIDEAIARVREDQESRIGSGLPVFEERGPHLPGDEVTEKILGFINPPPSPRRSDAKSAHGAFPAMP